MIHATANGYPNFLGVYTSYMFAYIFSYIYLSKNTIRLHVLGCRVNQSHDGCLMRHLRIICGLHENHCVMALVRRQRHAVAYMFSQPSSAGACHSRAI